MGCKVDAGLKHQKNEAYPSVRALVLTDASYRDNVVIGTDVLKKTDRVLTPSTCELEIVWK